MFVTVKDSITKPIAFSTIIVSDSKEENNIIAFASSNSKGQFTLAFETALDSLWVSCRHISHKTIQKKIKATSQSINFIMQESPDQLKEVLVKAKKNFTVKGDTISYHVDNIKSEKDYTIEEVISRIPGIKIEDNGQIKYNGKAISHLYINGLDLLEGGYNIATRGIPASAVKDIDVMRKHNHSRIDIGRTESDDVALNLEIKKGQNLVFGTARGDIGDPFLTTLGETTPLYLKDNVQNVTSLKANNIGKSLKNLGESLISGDIHLNSLQFQTDNLIQLPNVTGVNLSNLYWLDNESLAATNNTLVKINETDLIKINLLYNNGNEQISNSSTTTFIDDSSNNTINNQSRNILETEKIEIGLKNELNRDDFYFKNNLQLKNIRNQGVSNNILNSSTINNNVNSEQLHLVNSSILKNTIFDDKIIKSGLSIELHQNEELSKTTPSLYTDLLGNYNTTTQTATQKAFNAGAFTTINFNLFSMNWKASQELSFLTRTIETSIFNGPNNSQTSTFPFTGNHDLNHLKTITSLESILKKDNWKITLRPSLNYHDIQTDEVLNDDFDFNKSYLFFNPDATIGYKWNSKWYTGASYRRRLSLTDDNNLFNSFILRSFNNLNRFPNEINVTRSNNYGVFLSYSDILNSLFIKANLDIFNNQSDFTFSTSLDQDGLLQTEALEIPNKSNGYKFTTNISKTIFSLIKLDASAGAEQFNTEQFFNNSFIENQNDRYSTTLEMAIDQGTWYGFSILSSYFYNNSKTSFSQANSRFLSNKMTLDLYTSSKTRIQLGMENINSYTAEQNNSNTLVNMSFYYKPSKKLFLRLSLNNIFNEEFYSTTFSNANSISISQFGLRPRQITAGFNYTF
ncbi:hypothetical protein [Nonlabens sp.]|uniref:hypothetical protein n=1 Tax=Nonlabens sp. TaxID=1888209 RepID=UPI001BCAAA55|nr:hypothetical protein [Nonlabens sp.]